MNRSSTVILFTLSLLSTTLLAQTPVKLQPEDLAHPTVGTQNDGQTYPATGVPFAMTHWTPQTRAGEIKCISSYYFTDTRIQGFRGTHLISGSCVPDYGSMTLFASTGTLTTDAVKRASSFDRASEHATPYEYSVTLNDAHVRAAITGTLRAGMMRFTFTEPGNDGWILVENNARGGDGWVKIDPATQEITGEVPARREYAGSGKLAGFSGYFVIQLDRKFSSQGTWVGDTHTDGNTEQKGDNLPPGVITVPGMMTSTGGASAAAKTQPTGSPRPGFGVYLHFGRVTGGEIIQVRIGTSFTSIEEARKNLHAEIPDWNYAAVRTAAKNQWHRALSQIQIAGNSPANTIFYTALYHALLQPRTYSDVSGAYPRFASAGKIEHASGYVYYDDFSMWDTFRAQHPLLTILDPARDGDMMRSLVDKGEQGGFLPIFPAWNSYTSEMIGDHVTVTLIDAWRKGIRTFDPQRAYALMRRNALEIPASRQEYLDGKGRRGLDSYLKYGYIPLEDTIPDAFHKNEQVSRTMEYAYDDAILATFADTLGKKDDAALFQKHGENWRNVIDAAVGFARGRHSDGSWVTPFDPAQSATWVTEGLPFQYTFFVPQDPEALYKTIGGNEQAIAKLDRLFSARLYNHGNEPSHHIAYMYNAAGAPEKAQQHLRSIMDSEYRDGPGGLSGNDDAGQMSSWYVLSALGFYQVSPGIPDYWLGSPRFDDITIKLKNGRSLHILATGAEAGKFYVRQVTFNGKAIAGYKISYAQLTSGGTLRFTMSDTPPASTKY